MRCHTAQGHRPYACCRQQEGSCPVRGGAVLCVAQVRLWKACSKAREKGGELSGACGYGIVCDVFQNIGMSSSHVPSALPEDHLASCWTGRRICVVSCSRPCAPVHCVEARLKHMLLADSA